MKETVTLLNFQKETLVGDYFKENEGDKILIIIPGYGGTRKGGASQLAQVLVGEGQNCLVFDMSGVGESEGDFFHKTVGDWLEDCKEILNYARTLGYGHIAVLGTSTGGGLALELGLTEKIERILVRAPGIDYAETTLLRFGEEGIKQANKLGLFDYGKYKISYDSYVESLSHTLYGKVGTIQIPTLIIHGSKDSVVPLSQSQKIVEELPNATLLVIEGGDHSSGVDGDYTQLHKAIRDWFAEW